LGRLMKWHVRKAGSFGLPSEIRVALRARRRWGGDGTGTGDGLLGEEGGQPRDLLRSSGRVPHQVKEGQGGATL
jgi:hypothetical protein